jgi:hypothetical protein
VAGVEGRLPAEARQEHEEQHGDGNHEPKREFRGKCPPPVWGRPSGIVRIQDVRAATFAGQGW